MRAAKWKIRKKIAEIPQIKFRNILDPEGESGAFLITTYPDKTLCKKFTEALKAEGIHGPQGSYGGDSSFLCSTMLDYGLYWYFNVPSLINKTSNCSEGFPWTHPDNQFAKEYAYTKETLPVASDLAERSAILAIPSILTEQDIEDVINAFYKVANRILT